MNSADPTPELPADQPFVSAPPAALDGLDRSAQYPLEVKLDSSHSKHGLPQPGLFFAVGLTAVPFIVQLIVVVFLMSAAAVAFIVVTARPDEVRGFLEEIQVFLFPVGTFTTLLVAVAVSWLFFRGAMGRKIAWRGVSFGQLLCVLALTGPLAVLATEVTNCVGLLFQQFEAEWLQKFRENNGEAFSEFVALPGWLVFLGGCLLPGLGEEIYCRGLLSHGLVARYGVVGGTLLAAGLFGAMHMEPIQAIGAFALGIGLQFVFLTTRSLMAPIVLHTLNNSLAFLTMRFADPYPIPGLTPLPDGSLVHTPIMVLAAAILAAIMLMAIMVQNRTRWRLPDGTDWSPGYVTAEIPHAAARAAAVRDGANPLLILGAVVALGLFVASLVVAHLSVVVAS